jgi:hypothetical protein
MPLTLNVKENLQQFLMMNSMFVVVVGGLLQGKLFRR